MIRKWLTFVVGLVLIGLFAACQVLQGSDESAGYLEQASTPDLQNLPPELVNIQGQQIRQWAAEAEASSEYANPEWAATSSVGAPDTGRCGDYQTAWATAGSDSVDWLTVRFPADVHVTAVNIIQSFNPNQVVKVELLGLFDRPFEIYNQPPVQIDQPCPYTLMVKVDKTEGRYDAVRITVDQSVLGLGWNQIDAVELVGEPE
ncbi:hypothetical protein AMJ86_01310 [bacterium SM23_57]|nr:MAG: hypothetical protein AMJ86_01310 [bacterium SM23_57]